jgi:hypothetical protein
VANDCNDYTAEGSLCIFRNRLVYVDLHRGSFDRKAQNAEIGSRSEAEGQNLLLSHSIRVDSDCTRDQAENTP